jgi:hypothetical protein
MEASQDQGILDRVKGIVKGQLLIFGQGQPLLSPGFFLFGFQSLGINANQFDVAPACCFQSVSILDRDPTSQGMAIFSD